MRRGMCVNTSVPLRKPCFFVVGRPGSFETSLLHSYTAKVKKFAVCFFVGMDDRTVDDEGGIILV